MGIIFYPMFCLIEMATNRITTNNNELRIIIFTSYFFINKWGFSCTEYLISRSYTNTNLPKRRFPNE